MEITWLSCEYSILLISLDTQIVATLKEPFLKGKHMN